MDVWLLGGAAIVLIAITLWIVWPSRATDAGNDEAQSAEPAPAIASAPPAVAVVEVAVAPIAIQAPSKPIAREPLAVVAQVQPDTERRGKLGIGAAAMLALTGAVGGAWLYARWQRRRHARAPRRLKKRLFR